MPDFPIKNKKTLKCVNVYSKLLFQKLALYQCTKMTDFSQPSEPTKMSVMNRCGEALVPAGGSPMLGFQRAGCSRKDRGQLRQKEVPHRRVAPRSAQEQPPPQKGECLLWEGPLVRYHSKCPSECSCNQVRGQSPRVFFRQHFSDDITDHLNATLLLTKHTQVLIYL